MQNDLYSVQCARELHCLKGGRRRRSTQFTIKQVAHGKLEHEVLTFYRKKKEFAEELALNQAHLPDGSSTVVAFPSERGFCISFSPDYHATRPLLLFAAAWYLVLSCVRKAAEAENVT